METVAVEHVAQTVASQLDGDATGNDAREASYAWQHVLHGRDNGAVHLALVVVVGRKVLLGEVLCIGPRHVPHELHVKIGRITENEAFQLGEIGETAGNARQLADLLQGDDVPLLVADDGLKAGLAAHGLHTTYHLAVDVGGFVVEQVVIVGVDRAAADVGVADNQRVALCSSELIEILLYGILREAVANG